MPSELYALILAGGSGTRFWPVSRKNRPKQLLNLFDESTLLQQALERLNGLVPPENTLVLTNIEQIDGVREVLAGFPRENIIAEPAKRDTAPAVSVGVGWVRARDPNGILMVLPADQLIRNVKAFQTVMRAAVLAASETDALVTVGVKPTWACPSYGYIELGAPARIPGAPPEIPVYEVARFREKPSPEVAQTFLEQGRFTWNAGLFIWSVANVRAELAKHCPQLATFVDQVASSRDIEATLAEKFDDLPRISIDYALMENASHVLNVEASFDWDDVGSWISVAKYLREDENRNRLNTSVTAINAQNNIVYSKSGRHLALLGVSDLIVVQTDDAVLIANRHHAEKIKDIVDYVPDHLR